MYRRYPLVVVRVHTAVHRSIRASCLLSLLLAVLCCTDFVGCKNFYLLFVLIALITVILGSVNFFNEAHIVRYLKEICLFLIWISSLVIAITTAARQIPAERESRTIFPLLAKPVTRSQVVVGKFMGCWQAAGISLIVFYV